MLSRGELKGDWIVEPKGWAVAGRPSITMLPGGGARVTCKVVNANPVICLLTAEGLDTAIGACATRGAEMEAESAYLRQVKAGMEMLMEMITIGESPDTEWTLTSQPEQQGELPLQPKVTITAADAEDMDTDE